MNSEVIYRNYKSLACAVIRQVYQDYMDGKMTRGSFVQFCKKSFWFDLVDLNRDYFLEKVNYKKEHKKRRKYVKKRL